MRAVARHSSVSKGRMNWSIVDAARSRGSKKRKLHDKYDSFYVYLCWFKIQEAGELVRGEAELESIKKINGSFF